MYQESLTRSRLISMHGMSSLHAPQKCFWRPLFLSNFIFIAHFFVGLQELVLVTVVFFQTLFLRIHLFVQ